MVSQAAQLMGKPLQELMNRRQLISTLVYQLANVISCTAHAECSGGPNLSVHLVVKADGWATQ